MFDEKRALLYDTNSNRENKYYDTCGKIPNSLNIFLHKSISPYPSIALIAFF
jgi:hypothetical protein